MVVLFLTRSKRRRVILKIMGLFLVMDDTAAPHISGYQNGTLILGTTQKIAQDEL